MEPHRGLNPPPRVVCFDLLEMVLRDHSQLFRCHNDGDDGDDDDNDIDTNSDNGINNNKTKEQNNDKDDNNDNNNCNNNERVHVHRNHIISFPHLMNIHIFPLLTNALESELEAISFPEDDNNNGGNNNINNNGIIWGDDGPSSVSRLLCTLKLATTVLALYPHQQYHPISSSSITTTTTNTTISPLSLPPLSYSKGCREILDILLGFVKCATSIHRHSPNFFDDGFVFHPLEDNTTTRYSDVDTIINVGVVDNIVVGSGMDIIRTEDDGSSYDENGRIHVSKINAKKRKVFRCPYHHHHYYHHHIFL